MNGHTRQFVNSAHVKTVEEIIQTWPRAPRQAALETIHRYDLPHEVTPLRLVWHYNSPWKRTVVVKEGARHKFPSGHEDVLEQTVEYSVPLEKVKGLFVFNGSLLIDRTRGELTSRCNSEPINIAILNLAHQIIIGRLDVQSARKRCARLMRGFKMHWPEEITQKLGFPTGVEMYGQSKDTTDPDGAIHFALL